MKTNLLCCSASVALAALWPAAAEERTSDTPAGSVVAPTPTVDEDLVYLRDVLAVQTLRLDEAEQILEKQSQVIQSQAAMIAELQGLVAGLRERAGLAAIPADGRHIVAAGENLFRISQRYGTTVSSLAQANNISPPYTLSVGQVIMVPTTEPAVRQSVMAQAEQITTPPQLPQEAAALESAQTPSKTEAADSGASGPTKEPQRDDSAPIETVGVRPEEEEEERPYLAIFSDVGGILTPKGALYAEPAIEFTTTSDNRFFFQGVEIVDAVLIGVIEATDSDRRAHTESLTFRYGLTNRLELDARIPYISRWDRITGVAIDDSTATTRELRGNGLGDAEFGLHYQFNNGIDFPYAIANMRVKTPTGEGPFDVARDPSSGVETELAVGSGYWTVEPSLTFILSSDPAALYANVGYQMNLPTSPNQSLVASPAFSSTIIEHDAGDAIRTSVGVGLSLNERLSMNFGYDQSYFFRSMSDFRIVTQAPIFEPDDGNLLTPRVQARDPVTNVLLFEPPVTRFTRSHTPTATVGSFLFGTSYAVSDNLRFNFSSSIGVTDEAPDARLMLRAQYRLFD
jgi:LysM repeat protein